SEPHYTASRVFPLLLARRPILAVFHSASSVVEILARAAPPPSARVVTYDGVARAGSRVEPIYAALAALLDAPPRPVDVNLEAIAEFSAASLAARLAALFDRVAAA